MINESCEDCLVDILRLTESGKTCSADGLAALMKISGKRVSGILKTLENQGYVTVNGNEAVLTSSGLEIAKQIRKKNHIMEKFLTQVLGIDETTAHDEACRLEHRISDDSAEKLCRIIGEEDSDCSVCGCESCLSKRTIALNEMEVGSTGTILHLKGRTNEDVRKLISMGFVPGRTVGYSGRVSSGGPRIVTLGDSTVALDSDLSSAIFVERE